MAGSVVVKNSDGTFSPEHFPKQRFSTEAAAAAIDPVSGQPTGTTPGTQNIQGVNVVMKGRPGTRYQPNEATVVVYDANGDAKFESFQVGMNAGDVAPQYRASNYRLNSAGSTASANAFAGTTGFFEADGKLSQAGQALRDTPAGDQVGSKAALYAAAVAFSKTILGVK